MNIYILRFANDSNNIANINMTKNILGIVKLMMKNEYKYENKEANTKVFVCSRNKGNQTQIILNGIQQGKPY